MCVEPVSDVYTCISISNHFIYLFLFVLDQCKGLNYRPVLIIFTTVCDLKQREDIEIMLEVCAPSYRPTAI